MKKRILTLALALTLALSLAACGGSPDTPDSGTRPTPNNIPSPAPAEDNSPPPVSPPADDTPPDTEPSPVIADPIDPYEKGNTAGNIHSKGIVASKGDWIYYYWFGSKSNDPDGGLYRIKADGTEREQIVNKSICNINVVGDWIYFTDVGNFLLGPSAAGSGSYIYKIKTDGTGFVTLLDIFSKTGLITDMLVIGEWIYYSVNPGCYNKMKTDGTEQQELTGRHIGKNIVDGWMYHTFSPPGEERGIYKISTDGTDEQLVYAESRLGLIYEIIDGWIYYTAAERRPVTAIDRVRIDGTDHQEIVKVTNLDKVNVSDGWVYYTINNLSVFGRTLEKIRVDGTDQQSLLTDMQIINISVAGEWIFFEDFNPNRTPMHIVSKVKTDGTELQIVEGAAS
jgi:hypothetical protein